MSVDFRRATEDEARSRRSRLAEIALRSRANLGVPGDADPLTCDPKTACR